MLQINTGKIYDNHYLYIILMMTISKLLWYCGEY